MTTSRNPIIDRVDKKLTFSFGALMLVLMLLVTAASSYLFIRLQSQEEDQLAGALARIVGESVSKVSFSGTYHARLFVEEIKAKSPEITAISVESNEGVIIAHSDPAYNGKTVSGEDLAMLRQSLAGNKTVVSERGTTHGSMEKIIVLPYGGGIDTDIIGVIRLIVDVEKTRHAQQSGIISMLLIATLLSLLAVIAVSLLSRYFGSAVKALAMQLQAILDNSPALIYVKDRGGRYQFVNKAWVELFHTTNDKVKDKTDLVLFPEEIARESMANDQLALHAGTPLTVEERVLVEDELRYYHSTRVAVRDTDGTTYGLCGISTDISERKQTEETLRENKERLQLATQAAGIGIWDWDIVTDRLVWDESMYHLYGLRRKDFNGAYDAWFHCIHPDDAPLADNAIQAALRGEKEYAPEFRIVRPDGSIRIIQAKSRTYRDPDGKPLRMIGTNLDITERKLAEEQIRKLNEELEQRVRERTKELERRNHELEQMNKAFVGRELKMVELKEKIEELEKKNSG